MKKYNSEFKERAVRMLTEAQKDHPATQTIAEKVGCITETLRKRHHKHTKLINESTGSYAARRNHFTRSYKIFN